MIRWIDLALLYFSIAQYFVNSEFVIETNTSEFNDESISIIIEKLIQIEQKVNTIENRLKDIADSKTIDVEKVVAESVREYEMQRSLDRIAQKVEDVSIIQHEMKSELIVLNRNYEERREIPHTETENSFTINTTMMENLITSYQNRISMQIASLEKGIITIGNHVRESRDIEQNVRPILESHISDASKTIMQNLEPILETNFNKINTALFENRKNQSYESKNVTENFEKQYLEIRKLIADSQGLLYQRIVEMILPILKKNFNTIDTAVFEIQKNLLLNQIKIEKGFTENIPKYCKPIFNDSKTVMENFEKQYLEVRKLIADGQKPIQLERIHDDIVKIILPLLEKNFDIINKVLIENSQKLSTNQLQNIAKYGGLKNLIENEIPKLTSKIIKEESASKMSVLDNKLINSIDEFLKADLFESCSEAVKKSNMSGFYKLYIPGSGIGPFEADCRLDTAFDTGWTVIQRRTTGKLNFFRGWKEYKKGFGDPNTGEFWIGLEKIHAMTSKKPRSLHIEVGDFNGNTRSAKYSNFQIGNEKERYYLKSVGIYSGDAGNSLGNASITRKFTTHDQDNDNVNGNCAAIFGGAWWYDTCNWSDLNGEYNNTKNGHGVNWDKWQGFTYSLKTTQMAVNVP